MKSIYIRPNSERWLDLQDLPNEEWKDIKDFEGLYQISNYGRVKRLEKIIKSYILNHEYNTIKQKICRCQLKHNKYLGVVLTKNNKKYNKQIHRLVAETFIPNPENKPQVNHINPVTNNLCDNRVENLEWVTRSENTQHMLKLNRNKNGSNNRIYKKGKNHFNAKSVLKIDNCGNIIKKYDCVNDFIHDVSFCSSKCYKILKNYIEINGYKYVYENMFK